MELIGQTVFTPMFCALQRAEFRRAAGSAILEKSRPEDPALT